MSGMGLKSQEIKDKLIEINKMFTDGSLRYDCIDNLESYTVLEVAVWVAEQHPFIDGNKRTAIRFCEILFSDNVPRWIYEILKRA